ncbi:hypothetical protein BGZ58_004343 [Dissophora ornata]|nr:hypothetical protein BGZ58_004343 [Dissophora ornata]
MQQPLREVDVNDDPILVLSCGHVLTMTSLDGMMDMSSYYRHRTDRMTGIVSYVDKKELPGAEVSQVSCHLCRKPIVDLHRYGRRVNYAQLSLRLKKYQVKQAKSMKYACQEFDIVQAQTNRIQATFLNSLSEEPAQPITKPRLKTSRRLGRYNDTTDLLPRSNFLAISKAYGIPDKHERDWKKLIEPVASTFHKFTSIHQNASKSPSKELFDAAVSHLYRLKTAPTSGQSEGVVTQPSLPEGGITASEVVKACIVECGLPRDGHGGSSFVDSLTELTNVLLFVLAQAIAAMNKVGLSTGWYWFVQDLIHCATVYVDILKKAAQNGKFDRKLAHARVARMDLIYKTIRLKGQKDAFPTTENRQRKRLKEVHSLTEQFMIEMKEVKDRCPLGIKEECLARMEDLEGKMTVAIKIARGEMPNNGPLSYQEKLELFRVVNEELHGEGHWYRCPNGHTYVIGECGGAMQESNCPECGAVIGGTRHNLHGDNTRDTEFESMYRQHPPASFL